MDPPKLYDTFSYFETKKPTNDELRICDKVFITPDSSTWNPYSEHYSINEQVMLDDEGNIKTIEFKPKHIVKEDELHYNDLPSVDSVDACINSLLASSHENYCSHE